MHYIRLATQERWKPKRNMYLDPQMGCKKLSYCERGALEETDVFLKVTYAKLASAEKIGTDYYAFGSVARRSNTPNSYFENLGTPIELEDDSDFGQYYRYGFQGEFAEEDSETGWNSFELRMYDPVISRWLVPDPYKQFWSPYMSMANDPVNRVDPDGGCVDDLPCEGRSTNADGSDAGGFNVNGAFLPDEALAFNGPVETIDLGAALDFISNAATVGGVFTAAAAANLASGAKAGSSAPYLFVTPGRRILETTIPGLARSWSKIYPAFPNQSNVIRGSFAGAANGIGYVFTGLGIGISTYQYSTGQISTSTYAADLIFSRVGLAGPAGAGVSATYFLMVRPNNVAPPSQLYNDPSIVQQDATRQISINPNLRR